MNGRHDLGPAPIRPHDLLRVRGAGDLMGDEPPAWVRGALDLAPFVVVRRAASAPPLIPVGVRGAGRAQRAAAFIPRAAVVGRMAPEDLAVARAWRTTSRAMAFPHFALLEAVATTLEAAGLPWGPVGSLGFELASGHPCLTQTSDIDLLLRPPAPISRDLAASLCAVLSDFPIRIDAQMDVPGGAVALSEYASGAARIVLRSSDGPRLVTDPWQEDMP